MSSSANIPKGYKQTKVGVIPEDWEVNTVENALQIENNKRKPISELERREIQGIYPYYGPTKIQDYINEYQYDGEYALIAEDGDHFLKYRDQSMTQLATGKFNVNNHAHALIGTNDCLTKWFYWFYNRRSIYSHITRQGAGRYKLNKAALGQLHIAYPEVPEQNKIITILETWDEAIFTTQKLTDELKLRNKGLAQQLLEGKKRLKGFEGEWEEQQLDHFFEERKETNHPELPLLSVGETGVYPQSDSNKKDISNKDKSKYKRICPGDIGYNTMRLWQGRIALSSLEGIVSPAYTIVTPRGNAEALFFANLFKLDEVIHKFFRKSQGLVSDTLNCKFKDFKIVNVFIPPSIDEQIAIIKVLKKADKELKLYQQQLDTLKEQKKGLMQKLLSGQIRVNNIIGEEDG